LPVQPSGNGAGYALVVLDAWYRFLPVGISENDNAQIMALYNAIDAYAARLGAAWVNIHHASKGDQSTKGVTDVGSGAGSQSRAADAHLILRPHEDDGVAVLEAVVRSWPPVDRLAIRWEFPVWTLASDADPRRLRGPAAANRAKAAETLDADRQEVVNAAHRLREPATKNVLLGSVSFGHHRFSKAFASLEADGTLQSEQGQKRVVWRLQTGEET
jgi:hypothetical protein